MSCQYFEVRRKNLNCIIPIYPFQHLKMSLAAKGLLALLLSFPANWEIRMVDIISRSKNGRDSTRKAVKELIETGYLKKVYIRANGKLVGSKYIVFDEPARSI